MKKINLKLDDSFGPSMKFILVFLLLCVACMFTMGLAIPYLIFWTVAFFVNNIKIEIVDVKEEKK